MTKLKRIGRAVLTESLFSYAGYSIFNYNDGCVLTLSFLSDWSFRIYRGHFHFHKPSESTARPTGNAVTQSLHAQISQQLPGSPHAITSKRKSISPCSGFLNLPYRCFRELGLVCQSRVESHVRTRGYMLQQWTRRYSQLRLTQRNYISTQCPCVPCVHFSGLVVFSAAISSSHILPMQYRKILCSLVCHPDFGCRSYFVTLIRRPCQPRSGSARKWSNFPSSQFPVIWRKSFAITCT